ncbi:hypothetical protein ABB28_10485 [Stenotrophomonas chelatiphaga]|uniref:Uncharacterized protein n=1 Tax=Stenotrophomonas chelatiphaga TaxID=517011 RepID=A0A0R0D750_9GAMM|nr:hypothetical protein ABB28_10485 [Stenotrophomonas chelatiphaga]
MMPDHAGPGQMGRTGMQLPPEDLDGRGAKHLWNVFEDGMGDGARTQARKLGAWKAEHRDEGLIVARMGTVPDHIRLLAQCAQLGAGLTDIVEAQADRQGGGGSRR